MEGARGDEAEVASTSGTYEEGELMLRRSLEEYFDRSVCALAFQAMRDVGGCIDGYTAPRHREQLRP